MTWYTHLKTSLSACPVSERYMRGGIGFETKGKVVIVLLQMSFRPTCCPQGKKFAEENVEIIK